MLQWMGGSRRKVASSRKSVQNRQKQYFEQRKRQHQVPGLEDLSDSQNKHARVYEKTRSLDILSLASFATLSSRTDEVDASPVDSRFSQLSPKNVLKTVTPKYSEGFERSCSHPGSLTPTKFSSELSVLNVPASDGNSITIDKHKVQTSSSRCTSDNTDNKMSKQNEEAQNGIYSEVSVLDLLCDDGPTGTSNGRPVLETHVAFSVEGLGKVGIGTPVHSPRLQYRGLSSPPKAPRLTQSSTKHKFPQYNLGMKMNAKMQDIRVGQDDSPLESVCNARGTLDEKFNAKKSAVVTFSCMSPDVYEGQKQKFNDEDAIFSSGSQREPWNAAFGILDDNFPTKKNGAERKNKDIHTGNCPPFISETFEYNFLDYDGFRVPISPSSRTSFREGKRSNVSAHSAHCFDDLTSEKRFNPVSFDWERSSPNSTPSPPFLGLENSQDSMSLHSEESCSSAAGLPLPRDERSHILGSHSSKLRKTKIKQRKQNQKHSRENYDVGEFSLDKTAHAGFEEFFHINNNIVAGGIFKNVTNQWNIKEDHIRKNYSVSHENLEPNCSPFCKERNTTTKSHNMLTFEDDLFNSFPGPELYSTTSPNHGQAKFNDPTNHGPSNFFHETEILKQFQGPDVQLPVAFPWESKDKLFHSSSVRDFHGDAHFPGFSKQNKVFEDMEDEYGKTSEKPQHKDSAEKNSLSSNGRTAGVAASKTNCSENVELKDETQELFDGPATRDPSVNTKEAPMATDEEVISQLESCSNDKLNHFDSHAPVPSQVANQDVNENSELKGNNNGSKGGGKGDDASYNVMLQSYVFQLLCVQKVLMEASEKEN